MTEFEGTSLMKDTAPDAGFHWNQVFMLYVTVGCFGFGKEHVFLC